MTIINMLNKIDKNLLYLIIAIILDYFTGNVKAIIKKEINSNIGYKGILKKMCYFAIIFISDIIGKVLNLEYLLKTLVIYSLLINESISILENCKILNINIPSILLDTLTIIKNKILEKTKKITKE